MKSFEIPEKKASAMGELYTDKALQLLWNALSREYLRDMGYRCFLQFVLLVPHCAESASGRLKNWARKNTLFFFFQAQRLPYLLLEEASFTCKW